MNENIRNTDNPSLAGLAQTELDSLLENAGPALRQALERTYLGRGSKSCGFGSFIDADL
ncbi:hypothetical protein [Embleya sp. NPDC005971]|uniref:hypothetical protein n=1 Tax=unclassified Embleya TaxID=2699296 RepID=UPI003406245C